MRPVIPVPGPQDPRPTVLSTRCSFEVNDGENLSVYIDPTDPLKTHHDGVHRRPAHGRTAAHHGSLGLDPFSSGLQAEEANRGATPAGTTPESESSVGVHVDLWRPLNEEAIDGRTLTRSSLALNRQRDTWFMNLSEAISSAVYCPCADSTIRAGVFSTSLPQGRIRKSRRAIWIWCRVFASAARPVF